MIGGRAVMPCPLDKEGRVWGWMSYTWTVDSICLIFEGYRTPARRPEKKIDFQLWKYNSDPILYREVAEGHIRYERVNEPYPFDPDDMDSERW